MSARGLWSRRHRGPGGTGDPGAGDVDGTEPPPPDTDGGGTPLTVSLSAIEAGGEIPERYTADGADVSPPLAIEGLPAEAGSNVVVVDDPDAPKGTFAHWLLWNLPAESTTLPEDVPRTERVEKLGAVQATNDFGGVGYRGPAPPADDDPHRYRFVCSALDTALDLNAGAERAVVGGDRRARPRPRRVRGHLRPLTPIRNRASPRRCPLPRPSRRTPR
jgi:Raf kinase inhibitor-like YbhB/YbcL family protein